MDAVCTLPETPNTHLITQAGEVELGKCTSHGFWLDNIARAILA